MRSRWLFACVVLLAGLALVGLGARAALGSSSVADEVKPASGLSSPAVFLPFMTNDYLPAAYRLCRFGVGGGDMASYQVNKLRVGWYLDWTATADPVQPGGMDYMPMVRLAQVGPESLGSASYRHSPAASVILSEVAARPGRTWVIGNEPYCIWQDDLEPGVYAIAYHDLYHLIKTADPTAKIAAGSIVQATPLRLQYLDMVLDSYLTRYGTALPADTWNTHAFILREEAGGWGADIPPGIDATQGMLYEIDDNDNVEIFKQSIRTFRQWMANNGYQDSALIITEFGVQMPPDYGFPPDRVKAFMEAAFDFLLTATDATTGYPKDQYRLVQQWAWYSVSDDNFNGWLFDPFTKMLTVHGDNFAAYTQRVTPAVNLTPVAITASPGFNGPGEVISATLRVEVVNNGNMPVEAAWNVLVYVGDPDAGGVLVGGQTASKLDGCAASTVIDIVWDNAVAGSHELTIVVDPENSITELNELDNTLTATLDLEM